MSSTPAEAPKLSLTKIKVPISVQHVELLGKSILEHPGELCMCTIDHVYSTLEQTLFSFLPSRQSYEEVQHIEIHHLFWKAGDTPTPHPYGKITIPASNHLALECTSTLHRAYGGGSDAIRDAPIEVRPGNAGHLLLVSEQFGLAPDFKLPPGKIKSREELLSFAPLDLILAMTGTKRNANIWARFFIGDESVYPKIKSSSLPAERALQLAQAFLSLGCKPTPNWESYRQTVGENLRSELKRQAAKLFVNQNSAALIELKKKYLRIFGEPLTSISI